MFRGVLLSMLALALSLCSARAQLLYKISGNGLSKPSYIIGTFHLASASFVDDIPGAHEALNAVEQVCGEIDITLQQDPEYALHVSELAVLPFGLHIDDLFSEEEMARINEYMHKVVYFDFTNDYIYSTTGRLRPMTIASDLTMMLYAELVPNYDSSSLIDSYFQLEAHRRGLSCIAFETPDFQDKIVYLPRTLEQERNELLAIIDYTDAYVASLKQIVDAYYSQNMRRIGRVLYGVGNRVDDYDDVMIVERNKNWMRLMPQIMADKSTLFVVGAGHLPKSYGLVRLLRQAGYKVTAVRNKNQVEE